MIKRSGYTVHVMQTRQTRKDVLQHNNSKNWECYSFRLSVWLKVFSSDSLKTVCFSFLPWTNPIIRLLFPKAIKFPQVIAPSKSTHIHQHTDLIWHKIWMNVRKKSEYIEKYLNLTTKIELLYRNLYQNQSQKNLNLESDYLNFTKFLEKNLSDSDKIWMNGRSEHMEIHKENIIQAPAKSIKQCRDIFQNINWEKR